MRKLVLLCGVFPAALFIDASAPSSSVGVLPGEKIGTTTHTAGSMTRVASQSCGGSVAVTGCHRINPFLTKVGVLVGQRVLDQNQSTSISVTGTNGGILGNRGGFTADVTGGKLVVGTNTRIDAAGSAITHVNTFSTGRSWSFNWQAGSKTGLVEFYTVVNVVNGNGRADGGDEWAFHSSKLLANQCTPVRLFVNAPGVRFSGAGCDDGNNNYSVLGAPLSPTVGNSSFRLEAHGLPPSAQFLLMVSVGGNVPGFDLSPLGASGCVLRTTLQIQVLGVTSAGDAVRSEGRVILSAPIPKDTSLRGLVLSMQVGAIDGNPKRAFPMVVTNGIEVTIQ